jgi:GNAT superfamily N-acetyltransferase
MVNNPETHGVHIVNTKAQLNDFVKFPYRHYQNEPNWVAPLLMDEKKLVDTKKNPTYENIEAAFFLAEKNGEICGRIAAFNNHVYADYHKENVGFFGMFECIDDQAVANLLLKVASDWLVQKGRTSILGPFNPTMLETLGFLTEGFDKDPAIMMPYTKSYYPKLLEGAGFEKAMDLFAYYVDKDMVNLERIEKASDLILQRTKGLKIRYANKKEYDKEIAIFRDIFNKAWAKNWGFQPVSEKIFANLAKELKPVLEEDFAVIASVDGVPVGFSVALPDYNYALKKINGRLLPFGLFKLLYLKRKITKIRIALMGVIPEYQGKGIDVMMHKEAIVNGIRKGYRSAELGWVLESNINMVRLAERMGAVLDKKYRIYGKPIG